VPAHFLLIVVMMSASRTNAKVTDAKTGRSKSDVTQQALKLGLFKLDTRLAKRPRRRLSLVEHFKRMKGLELPPYLDE
jgi:hypothetical protein